MIFRKIHTISGRNLSNNDTILPGSPIIANGATDKIFRDPIHGFVKLSGWEQDIIDHPVFQRLRRVRQLALTEMVYPAACHARFEHSLGVAQTATLMFDQWRTQLERSKSTDPKFTSDDLDRARVIVRLAALLHDVGHCPFSHAGEEVMPTNPSTGKKYKHEDYSTALIRHLLPEVIDHHPTNELKVSAAEICNFLQNDGSLPAQLLFWRPLITGQMDADRADYLLRDSHHARVAYGRYDTRSRDFPGPARYLDEEEHDRPPRDPESSWYRCSRVPSCGWLCRHFYSRVKSRQRARTGDER